MSDGCLHPSFAIVVEALPFYFYTSYEWEGHKCIWNAQRRSPL
jgi:hypothetical protein